MTFIRALQAKLKEPAAAGVKLLIADDSNTDRLLLKTFLKRLDYQVLEASDGVEAVQLYNQHRPSMVLLDVLMPRMDGFDAAQLIKQAAGDEFVPIIFLTSLQQADSLARCLDAGGDDFLVKPYNRVILEAKLKAFSRMQEMHRTVMDQRDEISSHNKRLLREQEIAKMVFDKVAHVGCLDADNIQYAMSPIAIFNGDVALAGVGPSGNLIVLLGDFTGHGLDAAIGAMPMAQTFYTMLAKGFALADILREINKILHSILPVDIFCCAIVAEIDFKLSTVRVWNGGLPDCMLYHPGNKNKTPLKSAHLPLGIRSNREFNDSLESYEFQAGDRLYLWSDGIHEAVNSSGEMFGEQRLLSLLDQNTDVDQLFAEINQAVSHFIAEDEAADDISLIEVKLIKTMGFKAAGGEDFEGQQLGPTDWSLRFEWLPDTLKGYDPLPMLLQILMDVPYLRQFAGQIYTILAELYSNALEHGVLGLSSSSKRSSQEFADYYQLRQQRLQQLTSGYIYLRLAYNGGAKGGQLKIEIEDSGKGFDCQGYTGHSGALADGYKGRGITLLQSLCHSVEYIGAGNCAKIVFLWGEQP